jgi:hypothetical protein
MNYLPSRRMVDIKSGAHDWESNLQSELVAAERERKRERER